jgi:uncharacterized protein
LEARLKPFSLLVKPVGSRCNLDCRYCFYLGTDEALGGDRPPVMPQAVLERMLENFLGCGFPTSVFTWQGGEPTLAGLDFFRKVVEGQKAFGRGGQAVANALQTNGVLLDEEWAEFLAEYRFLVGLSLDGPQEVHDFYRTDRRGRPTFARVMQSVETLRSHRVEFNILSMVTGRSRGQGRRVYRWLVSQGFEYLQFIPCVEYDPATGAPAPENVDPVDYGRFMCEVFDEWYGGGDVRRVSVRTFDALVSRLAGVGELSLCELGGSCDHYLVVDKDGGVYPCDFFVTRRHRLGSLLERPLTELYLSDRERSFAGLKGDLPEECGRCPHLDLCCGGCLKDRLAAGGGRFGRPGSLCAGTRLFLNHARERLERLADSVRPVSQPDAGTAQIPAAEPGRNDPCRCGSGRKYKHCCMNR